MTDDTKNCGISTLQPNQSFLPNISKTVSYKKFDKEMIVLGIRNYLLNFHKEELEGEFIIYVYCITMYRIQVVEEILTILAGILHLGNVRFHMDGGAQISDRDGKWF